jgi:Bacterial antitoxin of ParD toxin-antitoxin type II system and RHH
MNSAIENIRSALIDGEKSGEHEAFDFAAFKRRKCYDLAEKFQYTMQIKSVFANNEKNINEVGVDAFLALF